MTPDELDELVALNPTSFHMADADSFPSIRAHGLLSTAALLERFGGAASHGGARRAESVVLAPGVVLRDQKPMDDAGLRRCLIDGLVPADWYSLINARVFFWLTRARLHTLHSAVPYRGWPHLVLELDTAALVARHRATIELSPINSGSTRPFPAPRGRATFLPIDAYPYADWRKRRGRRGAVVELTVPGAVPDIVPLLRRAVLMRDGAELRQLHPCAEAAGMV